MNMQRIEMNFVDNEEIHIPATYSKYCTSKVLTMEFIDGTKLNDVYESDSDEFDEKLLGKMLLIHIFNNCSLTGFSMETLIQGI